MNAVETRATAPAITICNGLATVLTTNVAGVFQKAHKDVLEAVETIIQRTPEDRRGNFIPVELERPSNLGKGIVKYKAYALTKAGFTFLAMGFTGEKADKFKWAYIDEFDRMEKALKNPPAPAYITDAQQREIQRAVGRRSEGYGINYQTIYSALKNHFNVPSYKRILEKDFEAAISFIQSVKIMTREECIEHEKAQMKRIESATYKDEAIPPKYYTVKAHFMEELRSLVYTWRYLHRANLERYVEFLRSVDSPYAASMWEAVHDFNWVSLEASLDKIGCSVKELPCYKHWVSHQPA